MKRYLVFLALISAPCFSYNLGDNIGPATSSSNVTIAAPGTGLQNCVTHVSWSISTFNANSATLTILDNGSNIWQVNVSTSLGNSFQSPLILPFNDQTPLCSNANENMAIQSTAGSFVINYNGYIRRAVPK